MTGRKHLHRSGKSLRHCIVVLAVAIAAGCNSGAYNSIPTGPVLTGNTSVTVLLSSSANDQLSRFTMDISNISLTGQTGNKVTLFGSPTTQNADFIHLNGGSTPLATVTVAQGVYNAASITIGYSSFTCISLDSTGGVQSSTFAYGGTPASQVTINMPEPITIKGTAMGLQVDLLVSTSATYSDCSGAGSATYSITPTLNVTPVAIASQPTNDQNGKASGLDGRVVSVDATADSFNLATDNGYSIGSVPDGSSVPIVTSSNTVYQGIADLSVLAPGMFVDIDGAIQANGSLLAVRVSVQDQSAVNVFIGPLMTVYPPNNVNVTVFNVFGQQQQGDDYSTNPPDWSPFGFNSFISFQISGQFSASQIQSLPFTATFSGSNMVAGQKVYVSARAVTCCGAGSETQATTVTLIPQTINGTVSGVSSVGNFAVYTVALAAYDLFPALAVQPGQTTVLASPGSVVVYVDGGTQMLNTKPLAAGSVLRFNGLVFNDNGTLRMDCAQVNDGISE
jgi:hypothetical protein